MSPQFQLRTLKFIIDQGIDIGNHSVWDLHVLHYCNCKNMYQVVNPYTTIHVADKE